MKKRTIKLIIALSLLITAACTRSGSGTGTGTTTALNSTETSLLGTWYLQSEHGYYALSGRDTTVSGYSNAYYITFMSNNWPPGTTTVGLEYAGTWVPGGILFPGNTYGVANDLWYYNTADNLLVIATEQSIMSLSGSNLVVTNVIGTDTTISTLRR